MERMMNVKVPMIVGQRMFGVCSVQWHKSEFAAETGKGPFSQVQILDYYMINFPIHFLLSNSEKIQKLIF